MFYVIPSSLGFPRLVLLKKPMSASDNKGAASQPLLHRLINQNNPKTKNIPISNQNQIVIVVVKVLLFSLFSNTFSLFSVSTLDTETIVSVLIVCFVAYTLRCISVRTIRLMACAVSLGSVGS